MRQQPTRPVPAGATPVALRSRTSLRALFATALSAAIGFVPAIMIASPAAADPGDFTISSPRATEGNNVVFTVSRAAPAAGQTLPEEKIDWDTTHDSATAPADYPTGQDGTLTFASYSGSAPQTRTITVTTTQDTVDELDEENFFVNLSANGSVAGVIPATGTGTILDDDNPTYTLTASSTTVNESSSNSARLITITARLSAASAQDIAIPVVTVDGTAKAEQDFDPIESVIEIGNGTRTGTVQVQVTNDDIDEADLQAFTVKTETAANVSGTQSVTINIADNDAPPVLTIGSPGTATEGDDLEFPVTVTGRSESIVKAKWATANGPAGTPDPANGSAVAGQDYTAVTSGTLTVPALATSPTENIIVKTLEDELDEVEQEDMSVRLSAPENATLGTDVAATGGILDSGTVEAPQVTLTPSTITEGGATTARARTFTVGLTKASGQTHKVDYDVAAGSADVGTETGAPTAGEDFVATSGTLTFAPGETTKTFTVNVIGDNVDEDEGENLTVTLEDASDSPTLTTGEALTDNTIVITDDDAKPVISLAKADVTMPETNGFTTALYTVQLSNPSVHGVDFTADVATEPGTAEETGNDWGDDDYDVVANGTIPAGQTSGYMLVVVKGDQVHEADETARFTVARDDDDATGGPIAATLTLTNEDAAPTLTVTSVAGTEGDTVAVRGVIAGMSDRATNSLVSVTLAGGAVAGSNPAEADDFVNPSPVALTIPAYATPGTELTIANALKLTDDTSDEPAETILVSGSVVTGVTTVNGGVVTINDNDESPAGPVTVNAPAYRLGTGTVRIWGTATPGATVQLLSAAVGGGNLANDGTTTTADADGYYAFDRWMNSTGMRFAATSNGVQSSTVTVPLRNEPAIKGGSLTAGTATLNLQNDPARAGLKVLLQRANADGSWSNVGASGTTDKDGRFMRKVTGLRSGTYVTFRYFVYGNPAIGLQNGVSPGKRVGIR